MGLAQPELQSLTGRKRTLREMTTGIEAAKLN
jgi:hypothetical protein